MSDLTVGLSVTTDELGVIFGGVPYTDVAGNAQVVMYDPGGVVKRRQLARSPTIRGGQQRSSIPDKRLLRLQLRIFGSTYEALQEQTDDWFAIFNQSSYQTTITINGVATTWACDDADYELVNDQGEGLEKFRLMVAVPRQIWEFRIPTDPDAVAGLF